ncbi:MAG: PAS domain-containing protein, partial [Myxococcales bacterium]|nr:PAS domain-containing protein [Myxococcales bacterium]
MSKQTDTGTDCQELQARYDALLAESAEQNAKLEAISKVQATIEFDLDGNVLTANSNFLKVLGYSMEEIQGRHHRMFVHPDEVNSAQYREFWESLRRGESQVRRFRRINKAGEDVFIEASYNPIFDLQGKPYKVVKFAVDVTAAAQRTAEADAK